jgi:hypothetical protein
VTARCLACGGPLPAGRHRTYCGHACRQRAFRARQRPQPATPVLPPRAPASRTATGVYECPECGERTLGQRRCDECNLFARRVGDGGCCNDCGQIITVDELLEATTN